MLTFGYFDPISTGIPPLDRAGSLVSFDLLAVSGSGEQKIQLVADLADQPSQLERGGNVIHAAQDTELATVLIIEGRAAVGGRVVLEGRSDRAAVVDFALRRWGEYADITDSLFVATNDEDETRPGVQVALDADGDFALLEVPQRHHYTVVFSSEPDGGVMVDQEHINRWVDRWAHWLGMLTDEPGLTAASVTIETAPDSG